MPPQAVYRRNALQFFTKKQKEALLRTGVRQEYRRKSYLFHRGDPGTALYVVEKGRVTISIKAASGREIILDTRLEGDIVGEVALLDQGARLADAIVDKNTTLIIIQTKSLLEFLKSNPDAYQSFIKLLCCRVRASAQFAEDLFHDNILKRTASKLLSLSEKQNKTSECLIEITQEELSKMLGSSREVVNRHLQFLQSQELIFIRRGAILIPNVKKLHHILHA